MTPAARTPRAPAMGFVLRFLGIWTLLLVANALLPGLTAAAIAATRDSVAATLAALGVRSIVDRNTIWAGSASIQIVAECTPVFPFLTLAASLVAFPASWLARGAGLALALPALWLYNVVRILVSLAVLARAPKLFDLVHGYLWQAATILVVVGLFLLWVRRLPGVRA